MNVFTFYIKLEYIDVLGRKTVIQIFMPFGGALFMYVSRQIIIYQNLYYTNSIFIFKWFKII